MFIGLILNINFIKTPKIWLRKGLQTGLDWSKIGAFYMAGETLSCKLRNVEDRYNAYIGSGISNAALRYKDGPLAIGQGFVVEVVFIMYVIDRVIGEMKHPSAGPTMESFQNSIWGSKKLMYPSNTKKLVTK